MEGFVDVNSRISLFDYILYVAKNIEEMVDITLFIKNCI